jgi:hypothetical protein
VADKKNAALYSMPVESLDMQLFRMAQENPVRAQKVDKMPAYVEPPKGVGKGTPLPVMVGAFGKEAYDFVQQPGPRRETQSALANVGDTLGWTTLGLAGTAAALPVTAPVTLPLAVATGAGSAGLYVGEGLVEMAGGDKALGAKQVALGLVDAATPAFKLGAYSSKLKKNVPRLLQRYVPPAAATAARLARELGINVAQEELRADIENPAVVYMLP